MAMGAQIPSPATSTHPARAILQGIVTKDPGGEPVKKAVIELIAESQSDGGNYTAISAVDGTFHIDGVAPGRYRLFVERTGYLEVDKQRPRAEGRVLTLSAGQELKDIAIRLQAAAVLTGRVTDEDGEPLPSAQVTVLRQTYLSGRSRWEPVGGERTNDLGEYRIAGLAAGTYYVSVSPPPDFKSLIESANTTPAPESRTGNEASAVTSYMTTYYPGTKDRSQAEPIQLHAGDEFPLNFSLTPTPSLVIHGSVTNLPAGSSAAVMLQSRDFSLVSNGAQIRKDGSFEIRDVSPGNYTVVATVSDTKVPMTARQSIQVLSDNVDGLRLAPQVGAWVHGRVRLEGKSTAATLDPGQLYLSLRSTDENDVAGEVVTDGFPTTVAHVSSEGSFEWKDVPPGSYYLHLSSDAGPNADWFLKSALSAGRDTMNSGLGVDGGAALLELVVSANGARVDGVITDHKGEPVANAVVVAVPAMHFRKQLDRFGKAVSDQRGHFTVHGLPPGEYTLLSWDSVDGEAYYNSDFLKAYEGQGKALRLSEGERATVQLQVIAASQEASSDQPVVPQ
jgi:hypothetical protein